MRRACACSCNELTNPGSKYISGHNLKNHSGNNRIYKPLNIDQKDKLSKALKGRQITEDHRENISKGLKGKQKTEDHRKKLSIAKKGIKLNLSEEQRKKLKERTSGENNPFYGKYHNEQTKDIIRIHNQGRKLSEEHKRKIGEKSIGRKLSQETREKISLANRGERNGNYGRVYTEEERQKFGSPKDKHHNWKDGISYEPYSIEWTEKLRESIKRRDEYICQNTYCTKNSNILTVHHIDYNKKNCDEFNLITLCNSCNIKANYNRIRHHKFYKNLINILHNGGL